MDYAVVGLQWGDEGKGKIVDCLINHALPNKICDVVRFNGGNNAGHTIVKNGKTYKLSLIPTGALTNGMRNTISRGVAFDPLYFIKELNYLKDNGIEVMPMYSEQSERGELKNIHTTSYLNIDEGCPIITPMHRHIDQKENGSIGTTCRGIGPAYSDYYARKAIRVRDLLLTAKQFKEQFPHCDEATYQMIEEVRTTINPFISEYPIFSYEVKSVLFEGAQGMMLDVFYGTYPYVTSSPANPAFASVVTGYHPKELCTIGVIKAYATRVGNGPFNTEITEGPAADVLSNVGKEVGTVTGRKRRVGWLDLTGFHEITRIANVKTLALTKLDVLDSLNEINVCVNSTDSDSQYMTLPGWKTSTRGITNYNDLPQNAKAYVDFIEKFTGYGITMISTGPESDSVILRPWR